MVYAARMLREFDEEVSEESFNEFSLGVNATLSRPFTFSRFTDHGDREEITLHEGTHIMVDAQKGIANYGNDYFSVKPEDYHVTFQN